MGIRPEAEASVLHLGLANQRVAPQRALRRRQDGSLGHEGA